MRETDVLEMPIARSSGRASEPSPLSLQIRRERGGAVIAVEPVTRPDLADALAELWFDGQLRRGHTQRELQDLVARLRPVYREDEEQRRYCAGFELTTQPPDGAATHRFFPRDCLEHVAARSARSLVERGQLRAGDDYYYSLAPGGDSLAPGGRALPPGAHASGPAGSSPEPGTVVSGPVGRGAPSFASLPIGPLLERASAVDLRANDGAYPVFYTRAAFERAERVSRKGAAQVPAIETGGLLIGPLCVCPETHEVFAVIDQVLEATDSTATTYSLTFSGTTWARIQTILRARREQAGMRHHRILGQSHGHNFVVLDGVDPCSACHLLPVCTRSSAHLSPEDRTWCRAVFNAEPWQISQVFGLDARRAPVNTLYGQHDASLKPRGYYLLDDFDSAQLIGSEAAGR